MELLLLDLSGFAGSKREKEERENERGCTSEKLAEHLLLRSLSEKRKKSRGREKKNQHRIEPEFQPLFLKYNSDSLSVFRASE